MADSTTLAPATNGTTSDFVSQLVPAICQVFFVIALGYLLGALNIIPVSHAKPLSRLCGVVLLPTAVFVAMLTLEGGTTAWKFLAGIVIAKVVIFVLVLGLGLAVDRTPQRYGQAAIRAIFCTQSNDFAFGLPIFQALFLSTHPGYSELLYIVAPISLVLLNPIGFGLMEFSRQTNDKDDADAAESAAGKKVLCKVLSKVSRDPLVIFTFLGIIGRLLFWATDFTLPVQVQDGLEMIGAGFTPVALFCLGLVCVGKFKLLTPTRMPLIAGLMLVKSLVAPVLCKLIFSLVFKDDPDLGNAAFIYGAIPTATGVFTYCTTYGMPHETIAVSMVLGTIVAAPIMLIFGFVLASASDPTSGLNSTSAAMDSAYLQEFPAMISILGCMYLLVVAAIFYRKMDLSRRALWSFLISAGVVGIVQCTAAFIDNLNCLTVNSNASTMGGYLNIWEQTAVILRVWAISQHRILVAAFGLLHLFLYGPGGLAKYPTRTGSEAQRVLNKKKITRAVVVSQLCAWGFGLCIGIVTTMLSGRETECGNFSKVIAWISCVTSVILLGTCSYALVVVNRRTSVAQTMPMLFAEQTQLAEVKGDDDSDSDGDGDGYGKTLVLDRRRYRSAPLPSYDLRDFTDDYDDGDVTPMAQASEFGCKPRLLVQSRRWDTKAQHKSSLCRLNTLLLFQSLSLMLAIVVSINTLWSQGNRLIVDGGVYALSLVTGFNTHIAAFVLTMVYATSGDLCCNCGRVIRPSQLVVEPLAPKTIVQTKRTMSI